MKIQKLVLAALLTLTPLCAAHAQPQLPAPRIAPAPMYADPIFDGPADPVVIWNSKSKEWWMYYSQRRANVEAMDVSFCYGTNVGVATSADNGKSWVYKGALALDLEPGVNTFWAPEVFYANGKFHMFVTHISGVRTSWGGKSSTAYYTSDNGWDWKFQKFANLGGDAIIDISMMQMPDKTWRLWFKDQANGGSISTSTSPDLLNWKRDTAPAIAGGAQEGPKVFRFKDHFWMVADEWHGQRVYRSDDALKWEKQGLVLDQPGKRFLDSPQGAHCDVVVVGDKAYIVYFVHPGRKSHLEAHLDAQGFYPERERRSVIQVAELVEKDGTLTCDRDALFDFYLPNLN